MAKKEKKKDELQSGSKAEKATSSKKQKKLHRKRKRQAQKARRLRTILLETAKPQKSEEQKAELNPEKSDGRK